MEFAALVRALFAVPSVCTVSMAQPRGGGECQVTVRRHGQVGFETYLGATLEDALAAALGGEGGLSSGAA